jgi:hypothetical protein
MTKKKAVGIYCPEMFGTLGCELKPGHRGKHKSGSACWTKPLKTTPFKTAPCESRPGKKDVKPVETLNKTNYRQTARKAVERYVTRGLILDAIFWSRIIGCYEAELAEIIAAGLRRARFKALCGGNG